MAWHCTPSPEDWQVRPERHSDRAALAALVRENAQALGYQVDLSPHEPLIATGHQAWLWHPGILAKDIAASRLAKVCHHPMDHRAAGGKRGADGIGGGVGRGGGRGGGWVHLVVDQDVSDSVCRLPVPMLEDGKLELVTLELVAAAPSSDVPTGMQPPIDSDEVMACLHSERLMQGKRFIGNVWPILEAFTNLPGTRTLAEQFALVQSRLMEPYTGVVPMVMVSQLCRLPSFQRMIERLLADPVHAAETYNQSLKSHGVTDIALLRIEADRVELPLWRLNWQTPRQSVWAVRSSAGAWQVQNEAGTLAPKALMLTALMRLELCDFFIHGHGGGEYDRATDAWIKHWLDRDLAPMAVVSADLYLTFNALLAEPADLHHAIWQRHHAIHNVDRLASLHNWDAQRKRFLLEHMNDDRNHDRRAAAFAELHAINERLAHENPEVIDQVEKTLAHVRVGLANRAVANKRDWSIGLYPPEQLQALVDEITLAVARCRPALPSACSCA